MEKAEIKILPIYGHNRFGSLIGYDFSYLKEIASQVDTLYAEYPHPKTGRWIEEPKEPLMTILRRINTNILSRVPLPKEFFGSVKGKSPFSNALVHSGGSPEILKIDLKKYFQNITHHQVFKVWHRQFGCSPKVSHIATRLTTFNKHLPTGAPTSPMLANFVIEPSVKEVTSLAQDAGLKNTQWIDDTNVSGGLISDEVSLAMRKVFTRKGLKINRKKTKLLKWSRGQVVTGFSTKKSLPRLPKQVQAQIRTDLYGLSKLPRIDQFYEKTYNKVRGKLEQLKKPHPDLYRKMKKRFKRLRKPKKK